MKKGTRTYKDADDVYWFVKDGDDASGYTITSGDTAKAAKGE